MKTSEEWAIELMRLSEERGGFDSEQDVVPIIQKIMDESEFKGWRKAIIADMKFMKRHFPVRALFFGPEV